MVNKDYYRALGIDPGASAEDIRKAFRTLAFQHHPDRNPDDIETAEARFKEINEAYEVLGDAEKRRRYDYITAVSAWRVEDPESGGVTEDDILVMLRRLADLGFSSMIYGRGKTWGCGRRAGWQCRGMCRQDSV